MNFTLKIMGTASAMPISYRNPSAQVLSVHGRSFLIDCGEGTQQQLRRAKVSFVKIEAIFITHIHGDHVFGLFGLLRSMAMYGRTGDLYIYGPNALGSVLNFFASFFGEGLSFRYIFIPVKAKSPELIHDSKYLRVSAFPLKHKIDCYGYRFDEKVSDFILREAGSAVCEQIIGDSANQASAEICNATTENFPSTSASCKDSDTIRKPGKSFAYCSDTADFPELADWVRGVDILYHEATYTKDKADKAAQYYHSTSADAARCAAQAKVGKLIVGHYSAKITNFDSFLKECTEIFPNTVLANEGDSIDF